MNRLNQIKYIFETNTDYRGDAQNNRLIYDVALTDGARFNIMDDMENPTFNNMDVEIYTMDINTTTYDTLQPMVSTILNVRSGSGRTEEYKLSDFSELGEGQFPFSIKITEGKRQREQNTRRLMVEARWSR